VSFYLLSKFSWYWFRSWERTSIAWPSSCWWSHELWKVL